MFDHITPVVATLHWLSVKFRIDFKIILFVFKVVNGLAPAYISNLLTPYGLLKALRSSDELFGFKSKGDRAFTIVGSK